MKLNTAGQSTNYCVLICRGSRWVIVRSGLFGKQSLGAANPKQDRPSDCASSGSRAFEGVGTADETLVLDIDNKLKEWRKGTYGVVPGAQRNEGLKSAFSLS